MRGWGRVLLVAGLLCGAALAQGAPYPQRPITIVVTAAAGGVTDVTARALGQGLTKAWGQPVVIENRGGAAHILGAQAVAKADADGYTLMVAEAGTFTRASCPTTPIRPSSRSAGSCASTRRSSPSARCRSPMPPS